MTSTYRTFAKTIIHTMKPGIYKEGYLKQFASQAFSMNPHPLYNTLIEHDSQEVQPAFEAFAARLLAFAARLLRDSELGSNIPLVPASKEPEARFDELQPEVQRIYESYPLLQAERISTIKLLCLEREWERMARGTLFFERETNICSAYFAVPRFWAEPQTPGLTPALLLGFDSVPVPRVPAAITGSHKPTALSAGSDADNSMNDLAQNIFSLGLETISTLSWATPAGPFVAAGITIFQAVFGPKQDLIGSIHKIAADVVKQIEYFQENGKLQAQLNALKTFSTWITNVVGRQLNVQNPETFKNAVTEPSGILSKLLDATSDGRDNNLLALTVALSEDGDLNQGGAYDSRHRWTMARAKLHLLFLATSQYLMALKLRITLLAKLDQFRYAANGLKMDPWESNSDNTFEVLRTEMIRFKDELPKVIEIVRARRAGMVVLEDNDTFAAISATDRPHSGSPVWADGMKKHDAIYWGYNRDRFVRAFEDNPTLWNFESTEVKGPEGEWTGRAYVNPNPWRRTEIRDKAIYDGKNPQDFILLPAHWGQGGYYANTERAEALKREYMPGMLRIFDEDAKIPGILESSLASLLDKWKPQIPMNLPADVHLGILRWAGTAKEHEIWSDKTIMVRYLFTLRSMAGNESAKSNDVTSSPWYEPQGRSHPVIKGFPGHGDYLQYVQFICIYRQFRKELANGSFKYVERKVAVITRLEGKDEFPDSVMDRQNTEHDMEALS